MAKNRDTEDKGEREMPEIKEADFCFVIMPFGGWYNQYYEDIFRPAIEEAGLISVRADSLYRPSPIVHDIWSYTKEAKVLLADLSGRNPNVLYELGLAHAIAKPAILVVESIDDVPFDLRSLRILEYDKNAPNWGDVLKHKITQAIKETLKEPLKSIPSAFLEVDESKVSKKVSPQEKEIAEIKQELVLLRHEVRDLSSMRTVEPVVMLNELTGAQWGVVDLKGRILSRGQIEPLEPAGAK